jgi:adenine-specific DNA methylase
MLTWGALNIVGADSKQRAQIKLEQHKVIQTVDNEITQLGIELGEHGDRAKSYLYCLQAQCPKTGWMIPLLPSRVISHGRNVIAHIKPDYINKQFDIEIISNASNKDVVAASNGTVREGHMVYMLGGKLYRTSLKTLRGDYRNANGTIENRLRHWEKSDFQPRPGDIFQERLYAIQWITKDTLNAVRQNTYFAAPTAADLEREQHVQKIVAENIHYWQSEGWIPDMEIEPGHNTQQPIKERGWTHWHHLFLPRDLLVLALLKKNGADYVLLARVLNRVSRLCRWGSSLGVDTTLDVFQNQALNTNFAWATPSFWRISNIYMHPLESQTHSLITTEHQIKCQSAESVDWINELWITDPPYADAVNYHEITEFFIAWLRKNPPKSFSEWIWDSRRVLAIKGSGDEFRHGMVTAYKAMAQHMPDNGMQCVMFTHQDTGVWSDLIGIFWAAGLQVVAAWYIATETISGLKKGGYVQGTVILMLKKRPAGERSGFKQRLLPAVKQEVTSQIEAMMHLNDTVKIRHGETIFNDADLQMAGYAAALKVLTAYTHIGGEDVTNFALRPRMRGEATVVDEIVEQAAQTASNLLMPTGLASATWARLTGIERFVFQMMDMEATGATVLDNYQNFAKVFRVGNYGSVMGDVRPGNARLKRISEYVWRDLAHTTEIGQTRLGRLITAIQQLCQNTKPQVIIDQLHDEITDFSEICSLLVDMLAFIECKSLELDVRAAAEILGARLKNLRLGL